MIHEIATFLAVTFLVLLYARFYRLNRYYAIIESCNVLIRFMNFTWISFNIGHTEKTFRNFGEKIRYFLLIDL